MQASDSEIAKYCFGTERFDDGRLVEFASGPFEVAECETVVVEDAMISGVDMQPGRSTPGWRQPTGAVYDAAGHLVEASRLREQQPLAKTYQTPADCEMLRGTHVYLGYMNAVYGHFLLESLARVADLDAFRAAAEDDIVGFVFHGMHGATSIPAGYIARTLTHFGVNNNNTRVTRTPLRIERLIVPCPHQRLLAFVSSHQKEVFRYLVKRAGGPMGSERLYLSRRKVGPGTHAFVNEAEVEQVAQSFGFDVIYPEEVPFETQLRRYAAAQVIAGPLSSALHNSVFCRDGATVIALNGRWFYSGAVPSDGSTWHLRLRSVQDPLCAAYDQRLHYIEAPRIFAIAQSKRPARTSYWIDPRRLAKDFERILCERPSAPLPESGLSAAARRNIFAVLSISLEQRGYVQAGAWAQAIASGKQLGSDAPAAPIPDRVVQFMPYPRRQSPETAAVAERLRRSWAGAPERE